VNAKVQRAEERRARRKSASEKLKEAQGFEDLKTKAMIESCSCNSFVFY